MESHLNDIVVVMVTAANSEEAKRISERAVESHLAACATMIPIVDSIYRWEGKLVSDRESLIMLKTTVAKLQALEAAIRDVHSYKVPEIIAMPVTAGSQQYLEWVRKETS